MTHDFPEEFGGHSDPMEIFKLWFDEAQKTQLKDPNAFVLSTTDAEGWPKSRVVLCKEIQPKGFVFYTNYDSAKGVQLDAQSQVAMNFFWDPMHRQVKITGKTSRLSREDSENYWKSRDRSSQLSQWVSKQSQVLSERALMEEAIKKAEAQFDGKEVPCPDHWGGYLICPSTIEFWVGRTGRFHDRHCFTIVENEWAVDRLYP